MNTINVKLADMRVLQNSNSRVALEYYRGTTRSAYIAFAPSGVTRMEESTDRFLQEFSKPLKTDKPLCEQVKSFMKFAKDAFLPDEQALEIIVDLFLTCRLGAEDPDFALADLKKIPLTLLFRTHCEMSKVAHVNDLEKVFKNHDEAEAHLYEMRAAIYTPTAKQEDNHAKHVAEAARRLSGIAPREAGAGKASKAPSTPRPPRQAGTASKGQGIGVYCCGMILDGKSNEQVLAAALKQFPGAKTSLSSVNWYRNDLKKKGKLK